MADMTEGLAYMTKMADGIGYGMILVFVICVVRTLMGPVPKYDRGELLYDDTDYFQN